MTKDTLREILTSIRNALLVKDFGVEIRKTRMTESLAKILLQEGIIEEISESSFSSKRPKLFIRLKYRGAYSTPVIKDLQLISRRSVRIYTNYKAIPRFFRGLGIVILSTSSGLLTDREAFRRKLGGEILCSIWLFYFYESTFFGKKNL
jgi:small subunit ribosomal protein S8